MGEAWARHREHILNALEYCHGAYTEDHILLGVRQGLYALWAGEKSVVVTKVNVYPEFASVCFFLAGGDLEELCEMEREIAEAAKAAGIQKAEIVGREGWGRALPEYEKIATAFMRDL